MYKLNLKKCGFLSLGLLLSGQLLAMEVGGKSASKQTPAVTEQPNFDLPPEILTKILFDLSEKIGSDKVSAKYFFATLFKYASISKSAYEFVNDYLPELLKLVIKENRIEMIDLLSCGKLPNNVLTALEQCLKTENIVSEAKSIAFIMKEQIFERYGWSKDDAGKTKYVYKTEPISKVDKNALINILKLKLIDLDADEANNLLIKAIKSNHADLVEILLYIGANPNSDNRFSVEDSENESWTALMIASVKGFEDIAQLLINAGANVNAKNTISATALIGAAQNGYINIVKMLIEANADINHQNEFGANALIIAVKKKQYQVVEFLVKAGADLSKKDEFGGTALMLAKQIENHSERNKMISILNKETKQWQILWQMLEDDIKPVQWTSTGFKALIDRIKENLLIIGPKGDKQVISEIKKVLTKEQQELVKAVFESYVQEEGLGDFVN